MSVHVAGAPLEITSALKIIITGYPKEIQFNVETNLIWGKFLNIRIFNNPNSSSPCTSVLIKANYKYDIIPDNSNVNDHYKFMAGLTYFRAARTHTSSKLEQQNQFRIVSAILKLKGFSKSKLKKWANNISDVARTRKLKKFLGTTVLDKVSLRHHHVKKVIKHSCIDLNSFYVPMDVPGPKLDQYILNF